MRIQRTEKIIILLTAVIMTCCSASGQAQPVISAKISLGTPTQQISPDFSGLSFEMKTLLPGKNGRYFFRPSNKNLIQVFKTLGIKCLRVGGNTADLAGVPIPGHRAIDSFFRFARAAHVKVIYTLRLRGKPDPQRDARIAGYIMRHYPRQMLCFAIGNEPNLYDRQFGKYRQLWNTYARAILHNAPNAKFDGPSSTGSGRWAIDFLQNFGRWPQVILLSQHTYVGGSAWKVPSPTIGREELLSAQMFDVYRRFNRDFGHIAAEYHKPFRLEETNSFYNGGAKNVSDTFASALWGLDYMWWWTTHGCNGLNFHTGNWVAAGPRLTRCRYAVFWTTPRGVDVHPLGYAMEAYHLAARGKVVPVHILAPAGLDLSAYAAATPDGNLYLTIINKTHGPAGRNVDIAIAAGTSYSSAAEMALTAPEHTIAARSGVTLGGASFTSGGKWNGQWHAVSGRARAGVWHIAAPAASAVIVQLHGKHISQTAQVLMRSFK